MRCTLRRRYRGPAKGTLRECLRCGETADLERAHVVPVVLDGERFEWLCGYCHSQCPDVAEEAAFYEWARGTSPAAEFIERATRQIRLAERLYGLDLSKPAGDREELLSHLPAVSARATSASGRYSDATIAWVLSRVVQSAQAAYAARQGGVA